MSTPENIKEDFILELMVFSPKYNSLISHAIADTLSDEKLMVLYEKINNINKEENRKQRELADTDPDAYDQKIKEKEEEEEKIEELLAREYDYGASITPEKIEDLVKEIEEFVAKYAFTSSEEVVNKYEGTHEYITNLVGDMENKESEKKSEEKADDQGERVPELPLTDPDTSGEVTRSSVKDNDKP